MASLYIKDAEANELAEQLAKERKLTKTAAVKLALKHELGQIEQLDRKRPVRELLEAFWRDNPLGEPTGLVADKAFYDSLNDEEDD